MKHPTFRGRPILIGDTIEFTTERQQIKRGEVVGLQMSQRQAGRFGPWYLISVATADKKPVVVPVVRDMLGATNQLYRRIVDHKPFETPEVPDGR